MSFSYSRIKEQRTDHSIKLFGPDHPFRHITIVKDFIQKEFKQYENLVKYNTSVELIAKRATKWVVTLREFNRDKDNQDYWYQDSYDAVIVANGHYSIPNIPNLLGLCEAQKVNRGLIQHTNSFRNIDDYINKRILVVGTGISSIDLVSDILPVVKSPLFVSSRGEKPRNDFNDSFKINENLKIKPEITRIDVSENKEKLIVYFEDGTSLEEIDKLILATGYVYDYPFFKDNEIIVNSNNRVENLFQHIFKIGDPTLSFVGIVIASITFRIFEYQSTLIARVLADRSNLPSLEKQKQWELELLCKKGNSPAFHAIPPDYQTYYEDLIRLAGKGNGIGHQLQPFEESWLEILDRAKKLKLKYWSRNNVSSHDRLDSNSEATL
ncbi:uncharacterized protein PRCAT00004322001 [Priceomyces carsonii]|uniref:uncharacterized protein n=1 Tax=Priceomyces carsonii TaxID=28549 RepID=UPI002EDAA709|nr:unnamed protein product [Priceomyces carsonii]